MHDQELIEKFNSRVRRVKGGCHLWLRKPNKGGYGNFFASPGVQYYAHRFAYEVAYGPIQEGAQIDHKCRNKLCVKPSHLHAVTNELNGQNLGIRRDNSSGYRGVSWSKTANKWVARVSIGKRVHYAGYFEDVHEAGDAAKKLRIQLFSNNLADRA